MLILSPKPPGAKLKRYVLKSLKSHCPHTVVSAVLSEVHLLYVGMLCLSERVDGFGSWFLGSTLLRALEAE